MSNKKGLLALSPLFLLILLIAVFTIHSVRSNGSGDNLSLTVAFMISSIYMLWQYQEDCPLRSASTPTAVEPEPVI